MGNISSVMSFISLCVCVCVIHTASYSPSFIFRIMEPWYLLIFQNFWNFNETSQVNTLSISDDNFLLLYTVVAYIICIIGNVLYRCICEVMDFFFQYRSSISSSNISMKGWKIEKRKKKILLNIKPINYVVTFDVHIWYFMYISSHAGEVSY